MHEQAATRPARKRKGPVLATALVLGAGAFLLWYALHEPTYEGRTSRQWVEDLRNPDPATMYPARAAIADHLGKAAVPALVEALGDPDSRMRFWVSETLKDLGPEAKTAVLPLIRALQAAKDDPASEKASSLALRNVHSIRAALGAIGPEGPEAVQALIQTLGAAWARVRGAAAGVLGAMGPQAKAAVTALTTRLDDPDDGVRAMAASALGAIGPDARSAQPALEKLLQAPEKLTRWAAAMALVDVGTDNPAPVVPVLVETAQSFVAPAIAGRREVLDALARLGPAARSALPELKQQFDSPDTDPQVRFMLHQAIDSIEAPDKAGP